MPKFWDKANDMRTRTEIPLIAQPPVPCDYILCIYKYMLVSTDKHLFQWTDEKGRRGDGESVIQTIPEVKQHAAKAIARAAKNRKQLHKMSKKKTTRVPPYMSPLTPIIIVNNQISVCLIVIGGPCNI